MSTPATESFRQRLYRIIFLSDSPAGKRFDVVLLYAILLSVVLVLLESVASVEAEWGAQLRALEWLLSGLFLIEYVLRIWCSPQPRHYILSFYGVVDLLAILPSFLNLLVPGIASLTVVRVLRLTRVFRILNLLDYVREARLLLLALLASRHRIIVFMLAVLAMVTVFGAIMFVVETPEAGFTSIPRSIYWAIVTLTTVGYGDIAPKTDLGQAIASAIMILGYAIIAIPTGIVSVEVARRSKRADDRVCEQCGTTEHRSDARYCHQCGHRLNEEG
ncbi:MAG: ion transporter [Flavobacteriales bacterium]|jgi:voltage-gated potassium channel|nr:ion transporter [Flavobacteriales bacterium]